MLSARTLVSGLVVLGLAGAGFLGVRALKDRRPRTAPLERPDPGPVPVSVRRLAAGDRERVVEAYGSLTARRRARLAPEIAGRVAWKLPDWRPGLFVEAGRELVRLEDTVALLAQDEAEALVREATAALAAAQLAVEHAAGELEPVRERLTIAQRELQRGGELAGEGIASASGLDALRSAERAAELAMRQVTSRLEAARAEVAVREAALARAEATRATAGDRVRRTAVVAPFDGWLVGRGPDVGTYVGPNVVVAELVDLQELLLVARVSEIELDGLVEGRPATVTTPSHPGRIFAGRVHAVGVDADPGARSVAIEVAVSNPVPSRNGHVERPPLFAGQFACAAIDVGRYAEVLTVERAELLWDAGAPVAFVLEDSERGPIARARRLELGRQLAEGFVVRAGLAPGETLIRAPLDRLSDGAACRAEPPEPEAPR